MVSGREVVSAAGKAWLRAGLCPVDGHCVQARVHTHTHAPTCSHPRHEHTRQEGARKPMPYSDVLGERWLVWVALEVAAFQLPRPRRPLARLPRPHWPPPGSPSPVPALARCFSSRCLLLHLLKDPLFLKETFGPASVEALSPWREPPVLAEGPTVARSCPRACPLPPVLPTAPSGLQPAP